VIVYCLLFIVDLSLTTVLLIIQSFILVVILTIVIFLTAKTKQLANYNRMCLSYVIIDQSDVLQTTSLSCHDIHPSIFVGPVL